MPNRIDSTFARLRETQQKAFVAYVAAGDPDFETSLEIIKSLADAGADIIELGLPFSDPLADGIVNQMAADRALKAGMSTARVHRADPPLPRDAPDAHRALHLSESRSSPTASKPSTTTPPPPARTAFSCSTCRPTKPRSTRTSPSARASSTSASSRPTTPPERVKILAQSSEGFIYLLSRTGVTGSHGAPSANIGAQVAAIRKPTPTPRSASASASPPPSKPPRSPKSADGVIVGSAIVKQVELHPENAAQAVRDFTAPLIAATRSSAVQPT